MGNSYFEIDAICKGVQRRYESFLGLTSVITKETADIARRLGMRNVEIQKWLDARQSKGAGLSLTGVCVTEVSNQEPEHQPSERIRP